VPPSTGTASPWRVCTSAPMPPWPGYRRAATGPSAIAVPCSTAERTRLLASGR
jgi:hypothetical protein